VNYVVELNGERREVAIEPEGVRYEREPAGRAELAEVESSPAVLVRIGTEVHRVIVRKSHGRGRYTLWVDGYRFDVESLDERTRAIRDLSAARAGPAGPAPIVAPMPGLIVRVSVAVGDRVEAGQGVVVMEAMKMENELRATSAGTVTAVEVSPGNAVEKGAILVVLE
jgi:pyruvate carboxylase subunit B